VSVLGEDALIVWDPVARREHFVRRARFLSAADDFGFLVPTPTRPELAEAPDAVFHALEEAVLPETVYLTGWKPEPTVLLLYPFFLTMSRSAPEGALPVTAGPPRAASVQVLEERRVAGYDASVLAADDARALADWLRAHGYAEGPHLKDWLRHYVAAKWVITAFKVAGGSEGRALGTSAVRMSFDTDHPFFPYREPADQRAPAAPGQQQLPPLGHAPTPGRQLRVFLVAPGRMEGRIGETRTWHAALDYAAPKSGLATRVAHALPPGVVQEGAWLHAFSDTASPRPGVDDLFFSPAAFAGQVVPPPEVVDQRRELLLPLDVFVIGPLLAWWVVRRRRRSRAAAPAA
jgi:hypothetical protein